MIKKFNIQLFAEDNNQGEGEPTPTNPSPAPIPLDNSKIQELEEKLKELTAERDRFKKERDEANSSLLNRNISTKREKTMFEEIFGGMR